MVPGWIKGTAKVAVQTGFAPHADRFRPRPGAIALFGAFQTARSMTPGELLKLALTAKPAGNGYVPFMRISRLPMKGSTSWQKVGLAELIVPTPRIGELPLMYAALYPALYVSCIGESTMKQLLLVIRPVSTLPPSRTPPGRRAVVWKPMKLLTRVSLPKCDDCVMRFWTLPNAARLVS